MSSSHRQALIDAPVGAVWQLVGNPARYPEWAGGVMDVTGLATIAEGEEYTQKSSLPVAGSTTTTFRIDELDELHEIRLRCLSRGLYSRWLLTEARDATFVDVEIGMEPEGRGPRVVDAVVGKHWYRRLAESSLDGLREALTRQRAAS